MSAIFRHIIRIGETYINPQKIIYAKVVKDPKAYNVFFRLEGEKEYLGWKFQSEKKAHRFVEETFEKARLGTTRKEYLEELGHWD